MTGSTGVEMSIDAVSVMDSFGAFACGERHPNCITDPTIKIKTNNLFMKPTPEIIRGESITSFHNYKIFPTVPSDYRLDEICERSHAGRFGVLSAPADVGCHDNIW